jgi:hypothetical protein
MDETLWETILTKRDEGSALTVEPDLVMGGVERRQGGHSQQKSA